MRKIFVVLTAPLMLLMLVSSCKKDKDDKDSTTHEASISFGNENYNALNGNINVCYDTGLYDCPNVDEFTFTTGVLADGNGGNGYMSIKIAIDSLVEGNYDVVGQFISFNCENDALIEFENYKSLFGGTVNVTIEGTKKTARFNNISMYSFLDGDTIIASGTVSCYN